MDVSKRKYKLTRPHSSFMTSTTKEFLQKICSKETASVDMTKYGFVKDSQVHLLKLYIKPLHQQLQKICGNAELNMPTKLSTKLIPKRVRLENNTYLGKRDKHKVNAKHIVKKNKTI